MQQMINKIPPKSVHFDKYSSRAIWCQHFAVTLVYAIWCLPLHSNYY